MLLSAQCPITNSYPVEVSGWDNAQSFFVEKSDLEVNEETGKCLAPTHSLRPGTRARVDSPDVVPEWEEGSG